MFYNKYLFFDICIQRGGLGLLTVSFFLFKTLAYDRQKQPCCGIREEAFKMPAADALERVWLLLRMTFGFVGTMQLTGIVTMLSLGDRAPC